MFDIETTAQLTGISPFTLRNWEKRFCIIMPSRTDGGHRVYSLDQVLKLKHLNQLISEGHKPNQLFEDLKNGNDLPAPLSLQTQLSPEIVSLRERILTELSEFRVESGIAALERLQGLIPAVLLLDNVYHWLLEKVGEQWSEKKLSIASEHLITAILRSRLIRLLTSSSINSSRPPLVFACAEGESHEGGLLMLACHLNLRGWNCVYLGANLPTGELYEVVKRLQPAAICLSYTVAAPNWNSILKFSDLQSQVCVGGASLSMGPIPDLPANIHVIKSTGHSAADILEAIASLSGGKNFAKQSAA
ncbi:MAG: MerR family transcriptional regulator [Bdellovibrionaceae bacterium]|nr:MerR family transcriptional regulator [Bdellovibrio sp.]